MDRSGLVLASSRPGHVGRSPDSAPLRRALNGALGVTNGAETAPSGLMAFLRTRTTQVALVEGYSRELPSKRRTLAAAISRPKHRLAIFKVGD